MSLLRIERDAERREEDTRRSATVFNVKNVRFIKI